MLHIIKQYKLLFTYFIMSNQVWWAEWLSSDVNEAVTSSDILTITEYKALLEKYKDNESELNKAVSDWIKDQLYRDARVLRILNKYSELTDAIVEEASIQTEELRLETTVVTDEVVIDEKESVINTDVFTRSLKKWMKWADVMALQDFLIQRGLLKATYKNKNWEKIVSADWKFGNWTKKALQKFQKEIGYNSPDGILTVSNVKTYKTLSAIKALNWKNDYKWSYTNIYARKSNKNDVVVSIDKSWKSLKAINELNEHSDEFYKALEAYFDGWFRDDTLSDMWGLLWWFEEVVWANNADDYFDKMKSYKEKLEDNEDKFNEELLKLLPERKDSNWNSFNEREYSLWLYAIRDIVIMAAFQDIPLFDIRLNFAKNLVSHWVPMDKAKALKNWLDWWMVWKPNYSTENLEKISWNSSLANLRKLRATLTWYGFSNKQIDFALKWDLSTLTLKQKKVLNTILNDRIIPDLETLRIGGFNFVERWFDDKDWEIKNKINRLTWNKHELWTISELIGEWSNYDVSLEKINNIYVLSIDDWGSDSIKVFESLPSKFKIKKALKNYNSNNLENWVTEPFIGVSKQPFYDSDIDDDVTNENFVYVKVDDNKFIVTKSWKYIEMNHKPTQKEINNFYKNDLEWFKVIHKNGDIDSNINIWEKLTITWEIIWLLKEQNNEDDFFGTEDGLDEWIKRVDSRYEYTKWIANEYIFAKKAISVLEEENSELFKRFSIISVFESSSDLLKAFPTNENVSEKIEQLEDTNNPEEYVEVLKEINQIKEVREYFDIISSAHKNNTSLNVWKNYRLNNINKKVGLKRINNTSERKFKYWEPLDIDSTYEEALEKMQNETTEKGWTIPSRNILWNIISWLIVKAWITDITETDLESAITEKWESIKLSDINNNIVNTARNKRLSSDEITSSLWLQEKRGDTHLFHTVIEKEVVLYKKNWEKVTITKIYDIYLRPECTNVLIIPWSSNILEKLEPTDFNMDITSLKTSTLPISFLMIKWLADTISWNWWGGWSNNSWNPSSEPIDADVITIPTTWWTVPPL